jgi:hypothetical protein
MSPPVLRHLPIGSRPVDLVVDNIQSFPSFVPRSICGWFFYVFQIVYERRISDGFGDVSSVLVVKKPDVVNDFLVFRSIHLSNQTRDLHNVYKE